MERGLSRKHIIEGEFVRCQCEINDLHADEYGTSGTGLRASLERLQLEYVDVVFANRPDSNTPIEGWCG